MAGPASDYHRGEMDIAEQTATFALVMGITKWGSLVIAAALLALVIRFCTGAGFLPGAIAGVVALAAGILLLRGGGGH